MSCVCLTPMTFEVQLLPVCSPPVKLDERVFCTVSNLVRESGGEISKQLHVSVLSVNALLGSLLTNQWGVSSRL